MERRLNENEVNSENKSLLRRRRQRRRAEDDPEKMIRRLKNSVEDVDAPPIFSFLEGTDRDPLVHLRDGSSRNPTRSLQQSLGQAAANDGTEDGSGPSVLRQVFTSLFWIVGFVVIFKCCGHKHNPRPTPSRDALLQQRERQRQLTRNNLYKGVEFAQPVLVSGRSSKGSEDDKSKHYIGNSSKKTFTYNVLNLENFTFCY